jgi:hypothetical protein
LRDLDHDSDQKYHWETEQQDDEWKHKGQKHHFDKALKSPPEG